LNRKQKGVRKMEKAKDLKIRTFDELKDRHLGKIGSQKRDSYEYELKIDLLGEMIRQTRTERKMTQTELGELIGVQKSQISRIERNAKNVTISTILRVFNALKAKVNFNVELLDGEYRIA
jgi:HTH-type transcriptional regulator / antitoxin HipB